MKRNNLAEAEAKAILTDQVLLNWSSYCPIYKPLYSSSSTIKKKAKIHSVLIACFTTEIIQKIPITRTKLRQLIDNPAPLFQKIETDNSSPEFDWEVKDYIPKGQRFNSRLNSLYKHVENREINKAIVNFLCSKKGLKNARKALPVDIEVIKKLYTENESIGGAEIYRKLKLDTTHSKHLTHRRINQIIKQNKHIWDTVKDPDYYDNNTIRVERTDIEEAMRFAMIDGSRYSYPYYSTEERKPKMLDFFIIIDVHSRKIIGWSISENENTKMILQSFDLMMQITGNLFPRHILSDNFSGNRTPEFNAFKERATLLGSNFQRHGVGNSPAKGIVENVVHLLEMVLTVNCPGFAGGGVRHKLKRTRKSDRTIAQLLQIKNLPNKNFVVEEFKQAVLNYNDTCYNDKPNADTKYKEANNVGLQLSSLEKLELFWSTTKKIKPRAGKIAFHVDKKRYSYQMEVVDLANLKDGAEIIVKFDRKDMNEIFCFDPDNQKLLFKCEAIRKVNMIKETELDKELLERRYSDNKKLKEIKRKLFGEFSEESLNKIDELKTHHNTHKSELNQSQDALLFSRFSKENYMNSEEMLSVGESVMIENEVTGRRRKIKGDLKEL